VQRTEDDHTGQVLDDWTIGRSARDTRRDLSACFAWKQVGLGFSTLPSRLAEVQRQVVHVSSSRRLRRVEVEDELVDVTGCVGPFYHKITVFYVLDLRANLVFSFLLETRGMELIVTPPIFIYIFYFRESELRT
jgi:hypothetical protein